MLLLHYRLTSIEVDDGRGDCYSDSLSDRSMSQQQSQQPTAATDQCFHYQPFYPTITRLSTIVLTVATVVTIVAATVVGRGDIHEHHRGLQPALSRLLTMVSALS